jgi:general stress protein 26
MSEFESAQELMTRQFGHDVAISLATSVDNRPSVRTVNGYYRDSCFYIVTYRASRKMQEVARNPNVGVSKDLFSARGVAEDLGSPREDRNRSMADELGQVFSAWYGRHVDEDDPATCILRVKLTDAVVFSEDARYVIDFTLGTADITPFVNDIIQP